VISKRQEGIKDKTERELYFTPKQAAAYLNLSLSTIKNYIYAGKLKTLTTPGGHHRINKAELLAAMGDISLTSDIDSFLIERLCTAVFNGAGHAVRPLLSHSKAVSEMSYQLSIAMGFKEEEALCIKMAGLAHDIGQIGVDRQILLRMGVLTPGEYEQIKEHPLTGERMLNSIKESKVIASIVGQHHEKIDGSGYPMGLNGNKIQMGARIISITEAYDAMVSAHSYKNPVSKDMAIAELMQNRGSQFDGDALEVFIKILR
jgi:excisionase family DNA binding protein/putative nucleotidyltransferase with HDIG domain